MPGPLAHWVVVREAALRIIARDPPAEELLRSHPLLMVENPAPAEDLPAFFGCDGGLSEMLYFGSILPDLGRYGPTETSRHPSTLAHRRRPADLATSLVTRARTRGSPHLLAIALGHISHIAADVLINPPNRHISGPLEDDQVRDLATILQERGGAGDSPKGSRMDGLRRVLSHSPAFERWIAGQLGDPIRLVEAHQDSFLAKHYFRRQQVDASAESWTYFLDRVLGGPTRDDALEEAARRVTGSAWEVGTAGGVLPTVAGLLARTLLGPVGMLLGLALKATAMLARYDQVSRDIDLDFREWLHGHRSTEEIFAEIHAAYEDTYREGLGPLPFVRADLEGAAAVFSAILIGNVYDGAMVVPDHPFLPLVDPEPYRSGQATEWIAACPGRTSAEIREKEASIAKGHLRRILGASDLAATLMGEAIALYRGDTTPEDLRKSLLDWDLETGMRLTVEVGPVPDGPRTRCQAGEEVRIRYRSADLDFPRLVPVPFELPPPEWAGSRDWKVLGRELARRGAPILCQTLDDPFRPVPVERLLGHPRCRLLDDRTDSVDPAHPDGRYRPNRDLDPHFHTAEHALDLGEILRDPDAVKEVQARGSTVYYRLKRILLQDASGRFRGEQIVVQYWVFYLNSAAFLPDGVAWKSVLEGISEHQGDWEFLQVIWSRKASSTAERDRWEWTERDAASWAPRWVGVSVHYYGEGRAYDDLRAADALQSGHPILYVAQNGHGTHFERGLVPAFSGMRKKREVSPGRWGGMRVSDFTAMGLCLYPPDLKRGGPFVEGYDLVEMRDDEPWLDWPGRFGLPGRAVETANRALRALEEVSGRWAIGRLALAHFFPRGPRGPKYRHPMEESAGLKEHAHGLNMWAHPIAWQAEFNGPAYRSRATLEPTLIDARWVDAETLRAVPSMVTSGRRVLARVQAVNIPRVAIRIGLGEIIQPVREVRPGAYVADVAPSLVDHVGSTIRFHCQVEGDPTGEVLSTPLRVIPAP